MAKNKKKNKQEKRADVLESACRIADDALLQALIGRNVVTREMALQIPTVRACIDKIALLISSIPILLYERDENGKVDQVVGDRREFLLNDDTGDTMSATQFWRSMIEDYYVGRGGFAYINRDRNNILSLHHVDDRHVSFLENTDPIFKDFNIQVNAKSYRPDEFLRILRSTNDGIRNRTIMDDNPLLVSVVYASMVYEERLVKKGGNKRGFLEAERPLTDEQMRTLKTAFNRMYGNSQENVVVLNNGTKFKESSNTSVEMQMNENKVTNASEICKLFGFPVTVLTGRCTDRDWEMFVSTCTAVMNDIECSLDRDLLLESEKGKKYFAFDTRELTRGNIKDRYAAYEIGLRNNFLQVDEVREREDMEPLGFEWIRLGLDSVLYNPKTKTIYTPNTNETKEMSGRLVTGEHRAESIRNLIITGPPGSGKTTWVMDNMTDGEIVVDLDAIKAALLGNRPGSFHCQCGNGTVELLGVIQAAIQTAVHSGIPDGRTIFITTCSDKEKLNSGCEYCNADLKVMDTPMSQCIDRIENDDTRPDKEVFKRLIYEWFDKWNSEEV